MIATDDRRGGKYDWILPQGVEFTRTVDYSGDDGQVTTITSAELIIAAGTTGSMGVTSFSPTVTVTSGTYMAFTITDTQTASLTPGNDYCYTLRATLSDGSILQVLYGDIESVAEAT